ncbi:MAG: YbdK family carboxylate-amine ligase [Gammaproteobacteria bacterium]|nr:YbdK family carboxylate-amine ligase [Gammaproteobacteria bacterium]
MLPFSVSKPFTLGVELEIQIINRDDRDLTGLSADILKKLKNKTYQAHVTPEVTKSMLEINSGVHHTLETLLLELKQIRQELVEETKNFNLFFSGGGTHPFQMWQERQIYPTQHYKTVERNYGYLVKMFTVFGMHVHVGCSSPNDALYLTHALGRYVPHLIALSASSPFCQGIDTQFCSSRSNVVNLFPLSGMPPFILDWEKFSQYVETMKQLSLVNKPENFYWDIRPRGDFGTVEVRVCDAPLTIEKAVQIAAFVQALSAYLLDKKTVLIADDYGVYRYNRFQASKWGFDASFVDPGTFVESSLKENLVELCKKIEPYVSSFASGEFFSLLLEDILHHQNDATWLRKLFQDGEALEDIVYLAGHRFSGSV